MKHFPPFSFDAHQRTLWRNAQPVAITPKAAALLACLLARPGSWVSKDAILSEVWPDAHVLPENIKVLVRELRRALGDTPSAPRFIASVHGFGYEFVAPVTEAAAPPGGVSPRFGSGRTLVVQRRAEIARLQGAWETARASVGQVALVEGDRGTGKTALCQAFLQDARSSDAARTCHGQCFDREAAPEPYYPLLDALQRLDRVHAAFVPALLAQHAPSWLARFPQWAHGRHTRAAAATPPRIDELRAWLRAASLDAPIAIAIEDVQWADAGSLRALTALADATLPPSVLLIATCCAGEWSAGRADRLAFRSAWTRTPAIVLGPLTVDQIAASLDARYGVSRGPSLAPLIHTATGGNAALLAALLDGLDGRGLTASGAWRRGAREPVASWVAAILRAVAIRQLDQLDANESRVLEAGAAVGVEFTASDAGYVLEVSAEAARTLLRPLARRGHVIAVTAEPVQEWAEERYRFRLPLFADLVAERAPHLRHRQLAQRASRLARRARAK